MNRLSGKRLARLIALALALSMAVIVGLARPADAHAELVATEPAAGTVVPQLRRVVLHFEEPVETAEVHVWLEDDGGALPLGPAVHPGGDGRAIEVPVPAVASGRYTVGYHLVAEDGDVGTGSFGFTLDTPPAPGAAPEPIAPPIPGTEPPAAVHTGHDDDLPAGSARALLDVSLASFVGGLVFIVLVWPQGASFAGTRRVLWVAAFVAALASFGLAVIQHAAASGLGLTQAVAPSHLISSLQFRFGRVAAARLALLAVAAVLTGRLTRGGQETARSARWCATSSVVAVGLFETVVLLGHNGSAGALAEVARLVHTIGVSIWLGGLVMLFVVVLPRRRSEELVAVLPRFSTLATVAVGALLVAGVLLSIELVGAVDALPTTSYGRILLLKLVVVAVLLVAASRSRDTVRRRLLQATSTRGRIALAGPVTTWVGIELGLMTVVLALTALLVANAPPG